MRNRLDRLPLSGSDRLEKIPTGVEVDSLLREARGEVADLLFTLAETKTP
jgi:hypothetical protein